jgi:hypothetical protein
LPPEIAPPAPATPPEPAFKEIGPITFVPFYKLDAIADESAVDLDDQIDRKRRAEEIRAALATLPARERAILEMHYYGDKSFAEIGAEIGICKPRACRIHQRALRRLARALGCAVPANDNADEALADGEDEDEDVAPVTPARRSANGRK